MSNAAIIDALRWDVCQSPTSTKKWLDYIHAVKASSAFESKTQKANAVNEAYERALRAIPQSYKLWKHYTKHRVDETRTLCGVHEWFQSVRETYERAVCALPHMPLLWRAYTQFVMQFPFPRFTMVRHLIGRSLASLPVTQHRPIWLLAKRWTRAAAVPAETVQAVWRAYLSYNPTSAARREYIHLLVNRGDSDLLVQECVGMLDQEDLVADPTFWETIRSAFDLKGWWYTGDWTALETMVKVGKQYCASSAEFAVSYAVFLYGQGRTAQGRSHISQVLGEMGTPEEFLWAYNIAIEAEDQLVDFFALSEEVRNMDRPTLEAATLTVFGSPDPLAPMRAFASSFPSKLIQVQLASNPLNASLWLKRIELLREEAHARRRSSSGGGGGSGSGSGGDADAGEVVALYKQAIAQCTTGMQKVDVVVGELFEGLAKEYLRGGELAAALDTLTEGAWNVNFFSPTVNATLLGLYAEVRLMTDDSPTKLIEYLRNKLLEQAQVSSRRARGALFLDRPPLAHLQQEPRAWMLLFDLVRCYDAEALSRFCDTFSQSGACTPEAVGYVVHALYETGRTKDAINLMELHLTRAAANPLGTFFLLSQFVSMLLTEMEERIDLHHFRELCRKAEALAPSALEIDPLPVVEFYFACAALETRVGLHGRAVSLLHYVTTLVAGQLSFHPHAALIVGVVEKSIDYTHRYKGIRDAREWCRQLMGLVRTPEGIQRVALHWAGLEKRMGHTAEAHAVLSACASTQNPSSPSGARFWDAWKKLSESLKEFEQVARREEQVKIQLQHS